MLQFRLGYLQAASLIRTHPIPLHPEVP